MPHDRYDRPLQVGDEILIRARVTVLTPGTDRCNLTAASVVPYPGQDTGDTFTTTACLVEKAPTQDLGDPS